MKQSIYGFILILLLIGFVVFGFWLYRHLPPEYVPIATGVLGFAASKMIESRKESKARLYEKKREAYVKLLTPWRELVVAQMMSKRDVKWTTAQMQKAYEATFDTVLYASDDVVKAYGSFIAVSIDSKKTPDEVGRRLSALLRAMRKDLGHWSTNLSDTDIMAMFRPMTPDDRKRIDGGTSMRQEEKADLTIAG
jgi:hypothetical protein